MMRCSREHDKDVLSKRRIVDGGIAKGGDHGFALRVGAGEVAPKTAEVVGLRGVDIEDPGDVAGENERVVGGGDSGGEDAEGRFVDEPLEGGVAGFLVFFGDIHFDGAVVG